MRYNLENNQRIIDSSNKSINSPYRQSFHIEGVTGLINDPNGLIEYRGEYHLFYQTFPYGVTHGIKYWNHLTTKDFLIYEDHGKALSPEYWFELDGCFSGNAFVENDKMYLFYTGHIWNNELKTNGDEYQIVAISEDGRNFEKKLEPIITTPKNFTFHYRDPKVWKHEDTYYLIVGAQTRSLKGTIPIYTSSNLLDWDYKGIITGNFEGGSFPNGYMWECPSFESINGYDYLFFCPQGVVLEDNEYNNYHQAGYVKGKLDYSTFKMEHDTFQKLDYGFEFYSPQVYKDKQGRILCQGWMGLPDQDDHPTTKYNYVHCLSMMTELKDIDGKLHRVPIEEYSHLEKKFNEINVRDNKLNWTLNHYVIHVENIKDQDTLNFNLRMGSESDGIKVSLKNRMFILDRTVSMTPYQKVRKIKMDNSVKNLDIYVDESSIEIFINKGEYVVSTRIFLSEESVHNELSYESNSIKVEINKMNPIEIKGR